MADLAEIYDGTRRTIAGLVNDLGENDLIRIVPATPEWRVRDLVAHLTGDLASLVRGEWPVAFFMDFGAPEGVRVLNEWTAQHVALRDGRPVSDILTEWEDLTSRVMPMLRGDVEWPGGLPGKFVSGTVVTDIAVHLHDLYGAFGIVADRDAASVRIATAGYIAMIDTRLRAAGGGTIDFDLGDKARSAGVGGPAARVRAPRFELFRALSGRRSREQVLAYDWEGDPEPFLTYFYPYGFRTEALVE